MATIPNIIKEAYYSGQLLQVADFVTEQNFHTQHREFQTQQLLTPGVLSGLVASANAGIITVTAGAAVDNLGRQILLSGNATLNVAASPNGNYQLLISFNLTPVSAGVKNQLKSTPTLVLSPTPVANSILLANVTIAASNVSNISVASTPAKVLPARLPDTKIENLNANVITTGTFDADRIPALQNLNGKLTPNQLPAVSTPSVVNQNVFSSGVLSGLVVTNTATTVSLTTGAAMDSDGNSLVLNQKAIYNQAPIVPTGGKFSIDMSNASFQNKTWLLLISNNAADTSSPILELVENTASTTGKVILATLAVTTGNPTITNDGRVNVLLDADRLPTLKANQIPKLQNLNGNLTANQIPNLKNLNGKILQKQLPSVSPVVNQNVFSAGILSGLVVTNTATTVLLTKGSALDTIGNPLILNKKAIYNQAPITPTGGKFSIDMSNASFQNKTWLLLISYNNDTPNSPILELVENTASTTGKVILATLAVTTGNPTITNDGRVNVLLDADRLPKGIIGGAKEYLNFWADAPIVNENTATTFNWKTDNGVDALTLTYLADTGIVALTTGTRAIQLSQKGFSITPIQSGIYTMTAQAKGNIVAQKQIQITVITMAAIADLNMKSRKAALDCATQLQKQFPAAKATQSAIAMAGANYDFSNTGKAIQKIYNLDPTALGQVMAAAFPS